MLHDNLCDAHLPERLSKGRKPDQRFLNIQYSKRALRQNRPNPPGDNRVLQKPREATIRLDRRVTRLERSKQIVQKSLFSEERANLAHQPYRGHR